MRGEAITWRIIIVFLQLFMVAANPIGLMAQEENIESACNESVLTKLPIKTPLTGKIPGNDWARGLKPGDVLIQNGVIRRVISKDQYRLKGLDADQRKALGQPPDDLIQIIPGDNDQAKAKKADQRRALISWIAAKRYGFLPEPKRKEIRARLEEIARKAQDLSGNMHKGKADSKKAQDRLEQMNRLLAKILIIDRDAYKDASEKVQQATFGRALNKNDFNLTESQIADKTQPFLSGKYFKTDKEKQLTMKVAQRPPIELNPQPTIRVERHQESGPTPVAVEGRIYQAEHPVFDWWEWGIRHASIVAGYWYYEVETAIEETYQIAPAPPQGVHETVEARRNRLLDGTLISKKRITEGKWKFLSWEWANGDAGSYNADDELNLLETVRFDSDTPYLPEDLWALEIAMRSYTGSGAQEGSFCRNRATSYPTGLYAFDFVCHQIGNAFMWHRRGYAPIFHWYSDVLFGVTGNQNISGCTTVFNKAMHGCIPGNMCVGNHFPYTSSAIASSWIGGTAAGGSVVGTIVSVGAVVWESLFEYAPGDGYGLELVWHPNHTIWSEAQFNSVPVNIPVQDEPTIRTEEDLPI